MKLVCKLKDEDYFTVKDADEININDNEQFTYTFWNKVNSFESYYSDEGIDLLILSLCVYAADRLYKRSDSCDSWTREIELYVPVKSNKWGSFEKDVNTMLNFLSGDSWNVHFRITDECAKNARESDYIDRWTKFKGKTNFKPTMYNHVQMLSGGLDSFIGAIDFLEEAKDLGLLDNILFISSYGGGKGVKVYQDKIIEALKEQYGLSKNQFIQDYAIAKFAKENTTRTRSFMFFSHAIAYATAMASNIKMIVPENGLISLNIPLSPARMGSSSTRTTHPYYMDSLRQLLSKIGIDVKIINPYQFETKGEMVLNCRNRDFLQEHLQDTMSCSHSDNGRFDHFDHARHCGNCYPCVIRRAAILKGGLSDTSEYENVDFTSGPTSRHNLFTYEYALSKFNPSKSFLKIQASGPIKDHISDYVDLYNRGMIELKDLLDSVRRTK